MRLHAITGELETLLPATSHPPSALTNHEPFITAVAARIPKKMCIEQTKEGGNAEGHTTWVNTGQTTRANLRPESTNGRRCIAALHDGTVAEPQFRACSGKNFP
jgi:hypothetical protein